jgi:hypothetical protein
MAGIPRMLAVGAQNYSKFPGRQAYSQAPILSRSGRQGADQMRVRLAWLDEQGLITLLGEQVQVARLTLRGADVASGAARCPGVARPRP